MNLTDVVEISAFDLKAIDLRRVGMHRNPDIAGTLISAVIEAERRIAVDLAPSRFQPYSIGMETIEVRR